MNPYLYIMKYLSFLVLLISFYACKQEPKVYEATISFETMGTFGTVKLKSDTLINSNQLANDIDALLLDVNMGVSTYIDSSIISHANASGYWVEDGNSLPRKYFEENLLTSFDIMESTNGAFNVFVKPLVDYWGFGDFELRSLAKKDSVAVDSILQCIANKDVLIKDTTGCLQLDFSAIAKGYGVDQVAYLIDSLGFHDYMVEIGGEVRCKGTNRDNLVWRLGIEEPDEEARSIYEVVKLDNKSMATSGNYRNFKILDNGQKVVHIINPKTGYPEISNLLSASIIADDCMTADAYATACMVMGKDTCYQFLLAHPKIEGYLIYSDAEGQLQNIATSGFVERLVD